MTTALILEDDALLAMAMSVLLEDRGYTTYVALNVESGLELAHRVAPDLLISDWNVNGEGSSLYVAEVVRRKDAHAKVVFVSGYPEEDVRRSTGSVEPCAVYQKPLNFDSFCVEVLGHQTIRPHLPGPAQSVVG